MIVRFVCPRCGKSLRADAAHAGRRGKCTACGESFVVPAQGDAAANGAGRPMPEGAREAETPVATSRSLVPDELVDMTAMVDIVFFLLIFFLVTSITGLESAIRMPAPEAKKSAAGKMQTVADFQNSDNVIVRIEADDAMYVDDEEVFSEQELREKLRAKRNGPTPPNGLLVVGAGDASHGAAVTALDAGSDVGMENVRLSVQDEM